MLIRPVRQISKLPPLLRKAKEGGWHTYLCSCCGLPQSRWVERGDIIEPTVTGYCPKSKRSEIMTLQES